MNFIESHTQLNEEDLKWTTVDPDVGTQEAVLSNGSKFVIFNLMNRITVAYYAKDAKSGNEIYHTPAGVPLAFMKAKQAASEFLGNKKIKNTKDDVVESTDDRAKDIDSINKLIVNPDVDHAIKNYGSVEVYRKMLLAKVSKLMDSKKNESIESKNGEIALKATDKLEVRYGSLFVNGKPFEASDPDEAVDWPKSIDSDGKLITWFKGRKSMENKWSPEEIRGHYIDNSREVNQPQSEISERAIKIVGLLTRETDRTIIESFLRFHPIKGHESELLIIETAFKRFKKKLDESDGVYEETIKPNPYFNYPIFKIRHLEMYPGTAEEKIKAAFEKYKQLAPANVDVEKTKKI